MSPYNQHEEPRFGHVSTGLGEAKLERYGKRYVLEVDGVLVEVDLSRKPPRVTAEAHYLEVWTNSLYEVKKTHKPLDRG